MVGTLRFAHPTSQICRTFSGGRPMAALPPATTIGRSIRIGFAAISAIS